MRIDVYRNLHSTGDDDKWSVKCMENGHEKYNRVIDHSDIVYIMNPEMVIHQSGLEKYRETGVKNAHAFVRGERAYSKPKFELEQTYYSKEVGGFITSSGVKIDHAECAVFNKNGMFVCL